MIQSPRKAYVNYLKGIHSYTRQAGIIKHTVVVNIICGLSYISCIHIRKTEKNVDLVYVLHQFAYQMEFDRTYYALTSSLVKLLLLRESLLQALFREQVLQQVLQV